jgi:chitin disaccharide deacetylase
MNMKLVSMYIFLTIMVFHYGVSIAGVNDDTDNPVLLIRIDDLGMSHAVNMAAKELFETGIPISASVMFACPWYQEAVEILKQYPDVAVGIHLTLNSEWKYYKWGPVAGRTAVPTLVDDEGLFFPSTALFLENEPDPGEVETELRAQIERAVQSGLHIDYVDFHMGTAVSTPELRDLTRKLADEYGLAMSSEFIQSYDSGIYFVPYEEKGDSLISLVAHLKSGETRLLVSHVSLDTPEMSALVDLNPHGLPEMSKHREAELKALTSTDFRDSLREHNIRLLTYRDLLDHDERTDY